MDNAPPQPDSPPPAKTHPVRLPALTPLPYLTAELPGVGGRIKQRPEDFVVSEIPAYEPSGSGTHVYFCIEKVGVDTRTAVIRIGQALGRPARDFGYAGMKDRHALTRQVISVEHVDPARVEHLQLAGIKVLWVNRHGNKLRLGHLRGNRFEVNIRGAGGAAGGAAGGLDAARAILDTLVGRGLPNYFGPQRFGVRSTGHLLGLALLRGDDKEFLDLLLGRPVEGLDYGKMLRARRLYEEGKFDEARQAWPGHHRDERAALGALAHGRGPQSPKNAIGDPRNFKRATYAVDRHLRRFLVSALQSYLFNEVVVARLATIDKLLPGDLAFKHGHGAVFRVEDPAVEQPRADRLEVSPSGPLYGAKMTWPTGEPEFIERQVLARSGVELNWFSAGEHHIRGDRRPLRIPLANPELSAGTDDAGDFLRVAFSLPSGAYATVVLRELMKNDSSEREEPPEPGAAEPEPDPNG